MYRSRKDGKEPGLLRRRSGRLSDASDEVRIVHEQEGVNEPARDANKPERKSERPLKRRRSKGPESEVKPPEQSTEYNKEIASKELK